MKIQLAASRLASAALWLAPWLLVPPQHEEQLVFAPRPNSSVEKQVDVRVGIRLTRVFWDDVGEIPLDLPLVELLISASFADTYAKIEQGRPIDYRRRFEDISLKWAKDEVREDVFGFHPLSDCSLRYRWQPDAQDYSIEVEGKKCRSLVVGGWIEDMDLRGLLPPSGVARGDEWTAKGRPLVDALFGPSELAFVGIPEDRKLETRARDVLLGSFLGLAEKQAELRCKYKQSFESGSARWAEIALRHSDEYRLDLTEQVNECLRAEDARMPPELSVEEFRLVWKVDGDGTLNWNVAEGHYESLELEAKLELKGSFVLRLRGESWKIGFVAEGTSAWTMQATTRE